MKTKPRKKAVMSDRQKFDGAIGDMRRYSDKVFSMIGNDKKKCGEKRVSIQVCISILLKWRDKK